MPESIKYMYFLDYQWVIIKKIVYFYISCVVHGVCYRQNHIRNGIEPLKNTELSRNQQCNSSQT